VNHGYWFYAIGAVAVHDGGFPGPDAGVKEAYLWARVPLANNVQLEKTNLTRTDEGKYRLEISGAWQNGDQVDFKISKTGYAFMPADQQVTLNLEQIAFLNVEANGELGEKTTDEIYLTFNKDIPDFTADDITISPADIIKGEFTGIDAGKYALRIDGSWQNGDKIDVTVASKAGYEFIPTTWPVTLNLEQIEFLNVEANGKPGEKTTDEIYLTFNKDIPDFTADDITISPADIIKGEFTGIDTGKYALRIDGSWQNGDKIDVTVSKSGYMIVPATLRVTLNLPPAEIRILDAVADGIEDILTTTYIRLRFFSTETNASQLLAELDTDDVTLTPNTTSAAKVSLNSGTSVRTLNINEVEGNGTVNLQIKKRGYHITPENLEVSLYKDVTGPIITGSPGTRVNSSGMVKFTSSEAGTYKYILCESETEMPSPENIKNSSYGGNTTVGENTINFSGLIGDTLKKVYIISDDPEHNWSEMICIEIPAVYDFAAESNDEFGSVDTTVNGKYMAGAVINVTAIPIEGFTLYEWVSTNGGTFEDPQMMLTEFTMPASDTIVRASFASVRYFKSVSVDGTKNITTSTKITLAFEEEFPDLSADDITLKTKTSSAQKVDLQGPIVTENGVEYVLNIAEVIAEGILEVRIKKAGYGILPASRLVDIHKDTTGPVLTATGSDRFSPESGEVKFKSDDVGLYKYIMTESYEQPDETTIWEGAQGVIDIAGKEIILDLENIPDNNAKKIWIIAQDTNNNFGQKICVDIPAIYIFTLMIDQITQKSEYLQAGSLIDIDAGSSEGYEFDHWTSTDGGEFESTTDSTTNFIMPSNHTTVVPVFYPILEVVSNPFGGGNVRGIINGKGYEPDSEITISVVSNMDYKFNHWSSDDISDIEDPFNPSINFIMPETPVNITMEFDKIINFKSALANGQYRTEMSSHIKLIFNEAIENFLVSDITVSKCKFTDITKGTLEGPKVINDGNDIEYVLNISDITSEGVMRLIIAKPGYVFYTDMGCCTGTDMNMDCCDCNHSCTNAGARCLFVHSDGFKITEKHFKESGKYIIGVEDTLTTVPFNTHYFKEFPKISLDIGDYTPWDYRFFGSNEDLVNKWNEVHKISVRNETNPKVELIVVDDDYTVCFVYYETSYIMDVSYPAMEDFHFYATEGSEGDIFSANCQFSNKSARAVQATFKKMEVINSDGLNFVSDIKADGDVYLNLESIDVEANAFVRSIFHIIPDTEYNQENILGMMKGRVYEDYGDFCDGSFKISGKYQGNYNKTCEPELLFIINLSVVDEID
jgi:hypothetical protein